MGGYWQLDGLFISGFDVLLIDVGTGD